jgi:hypothetical protein
MRRVLRRTGLSIVFAGVAICTAAALQAQSPAGATTEIPYLDVLPLLDALPEDVVPPDLKTKSEPELEIVWPRWLSSHDAAIRARAARAPALAVSPVAAAIDTALGSLAGTIRPATVHRVVLAAPGLDASMPMLTSAVAGSLRRHRLAASDVTVRGLLLRDTNIALERVTSGDGYDLVVGITMSTAYDPFEQVLAAINLATMLRPGGVLVSDSGGLEWKGGPLRAVRTAGAEGLRAYQRR